MMILEALASAMVSSQNGFVLPAQFIIIQSNRIQSAPQSLHVTEKIFH